MYPSPDLDLTIAMATQRERVARGWRRRPLADPRRSSRRSTFRSEAGRA